MSLGNSQNAACGGKVRLFRDSGTIDGPDRAGNHNAATAEANGGSEEGEEVPSLITLGVIVHQASVENDFLLIVRQAFHMEHQSSTAPSVLMTLAGISSMPFSMAWRIPGTNTQSPGA